jgi:hypothetical protein
MKIFVNSAASARIFHTLPSCHRHPIFVPSSVVLRCTFALHRTWGEAGANKERTSTEEASVKQFVKMGAIKINTKAIQSKLHYKTQFYKMYIKAMQSNTHLHFVFIAANSFVWQSSDTTGECVAAMPSSNC